MRTRPKSYTWAHPEHHPVSVGCSQRLSGFCWNPRLKVEKRNTDNAVLAWVHPALWDVQNRMGPKKGLKSGSYTAPCLQLKGDGITDILAWAVFGKGIKSLPFSHRQTWRVERRTQWVGRLSNQSPFSPDTYICSPPLMDLQALNTFRVWATANAAIHCCLKTHNEHTEGILSGVQLRWLCHFGV